MVNSSHYPFLNRKISIFSLATSNSNIFDDYDEEWPLIDPSLRAGKKEEGGRDTVFPLHTAHTHNGRTRTASPVSNVRLAAFAWRVVDWTVDHRRATATLCRISQFPTHQAPPSPQKGIDCSLPAGWPPRRGARVPSPIPLAPLAASLLCFVSCAPSIKDGGGGSQGGERASIFL